MTPAPISRRFLCGLLDGVAVTALSALYFLVPMLLRGVVLPMWGVLLAIIGYSVLPLAFLGKTPAMHAFGLELAQENGHPVDPANVAFRELVGRGLFPAAFLYTVVAGVVAQALGIARFGFPSGLFGLFFLACLGAVVVAIIGMFLALSRPDQRTLADLMSKSFVVVAPARPLPDDEDERAERAAMMKKRLRNVIVTEVVLMGLAFGMPWIATMRGGETSSHRIARIKREGLEQRFKKDPANTALAGDLQRAFWDEGDAEGAKRVLESHRAALKARDEERVATLQQALAKNPSDERTAASLVEVLEDLGRLDEAKAAYRTWLGEKPSPGHRAGFGHWLASVGFTEEAVTELARAVEEDPLVPMGHTMLGIAQQRLGRLEVAHEQLVLAVLDDPDDEDAIDALAEVEAALGPMDDARRAELEARLAAWRKDAGVE